MSVRPFNSRKALANGVRLVALGIAALSMALGPGLPVAHAQVSSALEAAREDLYEGRVYQKNFPEGKTREALRREYLAYDATGNPDASLTPKRNLLVEAIERALSVRTDNSLRVHASAEQIREARLIAWEALEALLQGQLTVGNAAYLKGLRVAFPVTAGGPDRPLGDTGLHFETPRRSDDLQYTGANLNDLTYARSYFLHGLTAVVEYAGTDSVLPEDQDASLLRAADFLIFPSFPQYTGFIQCDLGDPGLTFGCPSNNPPLPEDYQAIQTTGYLVGNLLDRYGKVTVNIGDRLWRAAYFDRNRTASERQEMLDKAVEELQRGIHTQYMTLLPLAATFQDGEGVGLAGFNDYEFCRLDQARVSAATAATLIERIRKGEIPKLEDFNLNSSTTQINAQLQLTASTKAAAATAYSAAEASLWRVRQAEASAVSDAQQLRSQFGTQLLAAIGIDPALYGNLQSDFDRSSYRDAVLERYEQMRVAEVDDPLLTNGTDLARSFLQLQRAYAEIESARNRIDAIPEMVKIEEDRVGAVNGVLVGTFQTVSAHQVSIGIKNKTVVTTDTIVEGSVTRNVTTTRTYDDAVPLAELQNDITEAQTLQNIAVNDKNAEAQIKNLWLQQHQYTLDLKAAAVQAQLAENEVAATLNRINRLIEDHIYYADTNQEKYYYDPALVFEQEREEIAYQQALRQYIVDLYTLAQLLAARWAEPYENPALNSSGIPSVVGGAEFDPFTQIESVFNVYRAAEGDVFFRALQRWDNFLRVNRQGGQAEGTRNISLRQDILGFSDVEWNGSTYVAVPEAQRQENIRRFRGYLLSMSLPESAADYARIEFPITYAQSSRSTTGGSSSTPLITFNRSAWNARIRELSARIEGPNVAPGASNNLYPLKLYQYGEIAYQSFFPNQTAVPPNFQAFQVPLYYPDPQEQTQLPFVFNLNAGVNGFQGELNPFVLDLEPTPYCSRYVLVIPDDGVFNLQNVEDIILTIRWRSGTPPSFGWPALN